MSDRNVPECLCWSIRGRYTRARFSEQGRGFDLHFSRKVQPKDRERNASAMARSQWTRTLDPCVVGCFRSYCGPPNVVSLRQQDSPRGSIASADGLRVSSRGKPNVGERPRCQDLWTKGNFTSRICDMATRFMAARQLSTLQFCDCDPISRSQNSGDSSECSFADRVGL